MASWSRFHWPKLAGSPSRLRGQHRDELRAPARLHRAPLGGSGTPQGTVEQGPHFKRPWIPAHGRAQQLPTPERCLRPNLPLRSSSISTRHSRSNGWPYTTTATSLTAGSGPVPVRKSNTVKSANGDVSINVKASPSPRGCASPRKTSVWPGLQSAQLSLEAPDTALPELWPQAPVLPCLAPLPRPVAMTLSTELPRRHCPRQRPPALLGAPCGPGPAPALPGVLLSSHENPGRPVH